MPFKSAKQRRWMWMNKPNIARRWTKKYGSKPGPSGKKRKGGRKRGKRR